MAYVYAYVMSLERKNMCHVQVIWAFEKKGPLGLHAVHKDEQNSEN